MSIRFTHLLHSRFWEPPADAQRPEGPEYRVMVRREHGGGWMECFGAHREGAIQRGRQLRLAGFECEVVVCFAWTDGFGKQRVGREIVNLCN